MSSIITKSYDIIERSSRDDKPVGTKKYIPNEDLNKTN